MDQYAGKTHDSKISKGRDGWEAVAEVELDSERWLRVGTHKTQGGIVTNIQAIRLDDHDCYSFVLFQDYNARVMNKGARCTEKTISSLHNAVMDTIEGYRALALEFYAAKAVKDQEANDREQAADQRNADFHDAPGEELEELGGFSDPMHY